MTETSGAKAAPYGMGSMAIAAVALVLAVAHISFGPFAPQKSVEETIVETAVKIKDAAKRAVTGESDSVGAPAPQKKWNVDKIISGLVLVLAASGILASIISLIRKEQRAPAFFGFTLASGVLVIAWLQWIALIVGGIILLAAIVMNLDAILS